MQRLNRIFIATAVIVLLFFLIGYLLPGAWHAERSVVIRAPVPVIFAYLNNLKNWGEWVVSHQQQPDLTFEYSGPAAGVGATRRWRDEHGQAVMKIMHTEVNERIEYRVLLDGGLSSIEGELILLPASDAVQTGTDKATRVVWRAAGAVGLTPVQRYAALWLGYKIGSDFETSLQRLKQKLEPKP